MAERKRAIRRGSMWAVGIGVALIVFHLVGVFMGALSWDVLLRSILFILGLFAVIGGYLGFYEAERLSIEDIKVSDEALAFAQQAAQIKPWFSQVLVGCIIGVTVVQFLTGLESSIEIAGLVKPSVREGGEFWRLLTGAALHGGILHIYFNGSALYGFGSTMEYVSNKAHLAIVFVLAAVCGGLLSMVMLPDGTSVGASGGIMGLIGYLAIYGYRRRRQLLPGFLKSMLINIGFITLFGLVAYQIVDNFGHLGGLLAGAVYGFVQAPKNLNEDPRKTNIVIEILGCAALVVFAAASLFAVYLMLTGSGQNHYYLQ